MFKLSLQHPSSEKLIVLFVLQEKYSSFPQLQVHMRTPPPTPCKYVCVLEHPRSQEYPTTYVSSIRNTNNAAVCANMILTFLMSSLCNGCCSSAETWNNIMLLKAVSTYHPRKQNRDCTAKSGKLLLSQTWLSFLNDPL